MKCGMNQKEATREERSAETRRNVTQNELRLKEGFVMIGVLQQTPPPAVLPEALFILRKTWGKTPERCSGDTRNN